ncbi:hypothetical protein PPL_09968 [Heterostelium album PN500]|uniref:SnoaL-like domain-containing protein n=1 Tax=Heterostelium pallidum (strain ATCC 26659 / Pp 5 / PN500) TaxID=670386 RepID=D3BPS4_HETP5|nr:hypothetical protein PPL_09968 [Heterostelium album PN500]EFA76207.1 hypothetical protein PPL_09968 [Heterostelium album PN500]|eukprot:XP_020428340.1 hypothetical protein PPL_09968 [Heterostelium album PN500]
MFTEIEAKQFAADWVESWNLHDLGRVLNHYTDDFQFTSILISSIAGDPSGTLKGKDKIADYWQKALIKYPQLHFKLLYTLVGVDSITLVYTSVNDRIASESDTKITISKTLSYMGYYNQFDIGDE